MKVSSSRFPSAARDFCAFIAGRRHTPDHERARRFATMLASLDAAAMELLRIAALALVLLKQRRIVLLVALGSIACTKTTYVAVDVGGDASCGIRDDGSLQCWGVKHASDPPSGSFVSLSVGGFACALDADGRAACWAGDAPPDDALEKLSCGEEHCCGLRTDRTLACWGNGPGAVDAPLGEFSDISAGLSRSCAVKRDDASLLCWGQFAQAPPEGEFAAVSVGGAGACAKGIDDRPVCWDALPLLIAGTPQVEVQSVVAGFQVNACAIGTAGDVRCWGAGEIVDDAPTDRFAAIDLGVAHGCGLLEADSTVSCWGRWLEGQTSPR